MSIKYLSLTVIAVVFAFASCTKDNANLPLIKAQSSDYAALPISGKWQETKVVTYTLDPSGNKLSDTTYLSPFTAADYALFNNDGSCMVSIDHYYFQAIPGNTPPQAIPQLVNSFSYKATGAKYVMSQRISVQGPGGGSRTDTVSLQGSNTLLIHTVAYGIGPNASVTDSYYTNK